jgi:hypothetical protein
MVAMSNKLAENLMDIKKVRPELTNEQAQHLLESMETYCEIIIDIYMENEVAEYEQTQSK